MISLKINQLEGIHDILRVRDSDFVILRNDLHMRVFGFSRFCRISFVQEYLNSTRFFIIDDHIETRSQSLFASKEIEIVGKDANSRIVTSHQASLIPNGFPRIALHKIVGPSSFKVKFVFGVTSLTGSVKGTGGSDIGMTPTSR